MINTKAKLTQGGSELPVRCRGSCGGARMPVEVRERRRAWEGVRMPVEVCRHRRAREGVRTPVEVRGGRPPLEVWMLGKECGCRRARAPWPLAVGGSMDTDAPGPWEGGEQAHGTSRSKTRQRWTGSWMWTAQPQTLTCLVAQEMERVGEARGRRWGGGGGSAGQGL